MGTVTAYIISGVMADYIFEPMFNKKWILVENIGMIIGTGKGRGIGFYANSFRNRNAYYGNRYLEKWRN